MISPTFQHEPTDACARVHCHSHHVDEDETGAFIVCLECGHVYRSAFALWRRYVAESFRIFRIDIRPWFLFRSLVRRPGRITFCQECIHDF